MRLRIGQGAGHGGTRAFPAVVLVTAAMLLALPGCRTIGDVNYVAATNLDDEGRTAEAFDRYRRVVEDPLYPEADKAAARYRLAEMHLRGEGTAPDPARAIALFEQVAAGPDAGWRRLAQASLGRIYLDGIPGAVEPDILAASDWFQAAYAAGDRSSADYAEGLAARPEVFVHRHAAEFTLPPGSEAPAGMERAVELVDAGEHARAFHIIRWHARRGNVRAQFSLCLMYLDGIGVAPDQDRALAWMYLAAVNGDPAAQHRMGMLHADDELFGASDREAERWLNKAAAQGVGRSYSELGLIALFPSDGRPADPERARDYFEKAVAAGHPGGLAQLGDLFYEGIGVREDRERAKQYYLDAAAAGVVTARTRLFERYAIVYDDRAAGAPATGSPEQPARAADRATPPAAARPAPNAVETYARLSASVFPVFALAENDGVSQGSAVALTETVAVTNCHVLGDQKVVALRIAGEPLVAERGAGDEDKDVCFLLVRDGGLTPVATTRAYRELKIGEKVYAIGSPQGLENTMSEGIVSGLRPGDGVDYIQTSAAISQGSSGGGLFDEHGRLIGLTTFKLDDGENLNFAVAIDEALSMLPRARVAVR